MEEQEIWKDIEGYEGLYQVSNLGRVKSMERYVDTIRGRRWVKERIMTPYAGKARYGAVILSKGDSQEQARVHRLVAMAFIPNPGNYPCVNHKDENPTNNRADNLEWCTQNYNVKYSKSLKGKHAELSRTLSELTNITYNPAKKGGRKRGRPVGAFTPDWELVRWFASASDAVRELNLGEEDESVVRLASKIRNCCQGNAQTAFGYRWRYAKLQ